MTLSNDWSVTPIFKKCEFFTICINSLGYVTHPGRLQVSKRAIEAVQGIELPASLKQLRSILWFCNVFRCFVPNFACMSIPRKKKLPKGHLQTFVGLLARKITALETLKTKLVDRPVMALPRSQGDFTIDTDPCNKQIGGIPLQKQPKGADRLIGHW